MQFGWRRCAPRWRTTSVIGSLRQRALVKSTSALLDCAKSTEGDVTRAGWQIGFTLGPTSARYGDSLGRLAPQLTFIEYSLD